MLQFGTAKVYGILCAEIYILFKFTCSKIESEILTPKVLALENLKAKHGLTLMSSSPVHGKFPKAMIDHC